VQLIGPLALNGGLRVDENDRFGTFTTYRAGAALRLFATTRLRIAAGSAFKEPTFFENYAEGFTRGNPSLEPERSRTLEAGIEQALPGNRGNFQVTAFRQRFRDLIQYVPTEFGSTDPNYANVTAARADGVELEWLLSPARPLDLSGSLTALKTEALTTGVEDPAFAEGEALLRRPELQATVGAVYRIGRLSTDLRWTHVGERADLDFSTFPFGRITLPAYDRVDLTGMFSGAAFGRRSVVTARVENLLDSRYSEILNFPARGRTLWLGVESTIY
jgi:vitamin B12 transporter